MTPVALSLVFGLSILQGVSGQFTVSSCLENPGQDVVLKGGACNYSCSVEGLRENEVLAIGKRHVYYTLSGIHEPTEMYEIYTNGELNPQLERTSRYTRPEQTPILITIAFSGAVPGDSGEYECHTEINGEVQQTSEPININVIGDAITTSFGRKKSVEDREIVQVYENNTRVNMTAEEYGHLVFFANISELLVWEVLGTVRVVRNGQETVFEERAETDLTDYTPREVLPTNSHYVEMFENFDMTLEEGDELVITGRLDYYSRKYFSTLNVLILNGNDAQGTDRKSVV